MKAYYPPQVRDGGIPKVLKGVRKVVRVGACCDHAQFCAKMDLKRIRYWGKA